VPDGLEQRVTTLEKDLAELQQLVEGQQDWSHRKRLHRLEDDDRGVTVAAEALRAYKATKFSLRSQLREWGAFVLAAVAIALSKGWL